MPTRKMTTPAENCAGGLKATVPIKGRKACDDLSGNLHTCITCITGVTEAHQPPKLTERVQLPCDAPTERMTRMDEMVIKAAEKILAQGDRAELVPGPNGTVKVIHVKRTVAASGRR